MRKRAIIAYKPWTVQTRAVAVPDAQVRLRAVVGVLLAEVGDAPTTEQAPAGQPSEQSGDLASRR